MKTLFCLLIACVLTSTASGQRRRPAAKDSLSLGCILLQPVYDPPEVSSIPGQGELKLVVSSASDTTVKSPWDLTVFSVRRVEGGDYELVAYHQDYWFWFSGISRPVAGKGSIVKTGHALAVLLPGKKVELLVYDFETPVDPAKYLNCRN